MIATISGVNESDDDDVNDVDGDKGIITVITLAKIELFLDLWGLSDNKTMGGTNARSRNFR